MKMKFTDKSRNQFEAAITAALELLNEGDSILTNPCIYAETGGISRKEIGFCFGSKDYMQEGDVLWIMVEEDAFGDYNALADLDDEVAGIADRMWVDAVNDISDAIQEDFSRIGLGDNH